jgi:hypothetical protein
MIRIDRYDADFIFYAPGINTVFYRDQQIHAISQGGYLIPDPVTSTIPIPQPDFFLRATAYPNPLNPSTIVRIDLPSRTLVRADIYDCSGRLIKKIWHGVLPQGRSTLAWNGRNDRGSRVASGVYFLAIQSRGYRKTIKLVVVK